MTVGGMKRRCNGRTWLPLSIIRRHYTFLAQHYQYASPPDFAQAHLFYRQAAEQDFPAAHWQLGLQYKLGQGTEPNKQLAVVHLRHAADSGIAAAQTMLADLLLETDPTEANNTV